MIDTFAFTLLGTIAGYGIGSVTFAAIGDLQLKLARRRADHFRDRALKAEEKVRKHKEACALGARNSHKVQAEKREAKQIEDRAAIRATAERLKAEVAAGKAKPLPPRADVVAGVCRRRANDYSDIIEAMRTGQDVTA